MAKKDSKQPKQQKSKINEPTYSYEDILSQVNSLKERPEVIAGALLSSKKERFTRQDIKSLLKEFKEKEVK